MKRTKYIFVMGGVLSGLGKGIAVSSIGNLLSAKGYSITSMKIDPYVNVDAGTMNPTEHGEVFVTKDGLETDQDIGNYERFLDKELVKDNYMTTGQVYLSVIQRERNLDYRGKCVEVVPHIPQEVIRRIELLGRKSKADFVTIEIGGTVGEYQNLIFLEAGRMLKLKNPEDVLFIIVSYLPITKVVGEMKTKPTQYAVRTLNSAGIQPDFILCRSEQPLDKPRREKLSIFCNTPPENIISAHDVDTIYEVPLNFEKEKLADKILNNFKLKPKKKDLKEWKKLINTAKRAKKIVKIAIVGKYFGIGRFTLSDSYISVIEAIKHAVWYQKARPEISWLDSEDYEKDPSSIKQLKNYDGIIVPGGFGSRGVEGKIKAIEFVRKNNIPYFGLCYGMQLAVIEFARNVLKLKNANSTEIDPKTPDPIIDLLPEQKKLMIEKNYGGTMRLGNYTCKLVKDTLAKKAYGKNSILERHRHRYEFNNKYWEKMEKAGLKVAGVFTKIKLVEIVELKNHPFLVGVQFHPEFKSRPLTPHPLFREFARAALNNKKKKAKK